MAPSSSLPTHHLDGPLVYQTADALPNAPVPLMVSSRHHIEQKDTACYPSYDSSSDYLNTVTHSNPPLALSLAIMNPWSTMFSTIKPHSQHPICLTQNGHHLLLTNLYPATPPHLPLLLLIGMSLTKSATPSKSCIFPPPSNTLKDTKTVPHLTSASPY